MKRTHSLFEKPPVPTQLQNLWREVDAGRLTRQEFTERQDALINQYIAIWSEALRLPDESDLTRSLCRELANLTGCEDLEVVKDHCRKAVIAMRDEWHEIVREEDGASIEEYYDKSQNYAYELMWWHTLEEDHSPLAYVCALHLACQNGCESFLDFGAGTGSGGLLFSRHGAKITLADISSTRLDSLGFTEIWRDEWLWGHQAFRKAAA